MKRGSASVQVRGSRQVVTLERHALGTLQYIRSSMEAASSFDVPGLAGVAMGTVGAVSAVLSPPADFSHDWLAHWLVTAAIAFFCGAALMMRDAASAGRTLYRGPARRFCLALLPSLGTGAILTFVLWRASSPQLLPGTWLLLYGCGVLSASFMTTRLVAAMGGLFVATAIAAFELPSSWSNAVLGAGFGGLHLVFGFIIGRSSPLNGDELR